MCTKLIPKGSGEPGAGREALLPRLQEIHRQKRWLDADDLLEVARDLKLSPAIVYGTASFYSFLDTEPRGKHIIRICRTIGCYMKGKDEIIRTIEVRLKIRLGETTRDGRFSFLAANCMGWCHKGPAMLIDEEVFTELTPQKTLRILDEFIRERKVRA